MASAQQRGVLGRLADWVTRLFEKIPDASQASATGAALLEGVGWTEFERQVAEGFRHRGYAVSDMGGAGAREVDMVLHRGPERFLVDCKPWRSVAVGLAPLQELSRLIGVRGAAGGFVLSSGAFTPEAIQFAVAHGIVLIDGRSLRDLLNTSIEKTQPLVRRQAPFLETTLPPSAWRKASGQVCPVCASPMDERVASGASGAPDGPRGTQRLLVCSRFPQCQGKRSLP